MAEMADGSDVSELGLGGGDQGPGKTYHPKRPHRKSRNGCRNCKKRKVKCDEARPSCGTCSKREDTCVYLSPPSPVSSDRDAHTGALLPPSPPSSLTSAQPSPPPSEVAIYDPQPQPLQLLQEPIFLPRDLDLDEVRLLWAYNSSTYLSFVTNRNGANKLEYALRTRVLEYAVTTPFLMDCVLALTSLHMECLGNKELEIPEAKAIVYRARAFEGYRRAVEAADPATFPALVACSLLLCAVSAQTFRAEGEASRLYILNWIIVWRGIGLVLNLTDPKRLGHSGLAALFVRPPINLNLSALHIPSNLLFMVSSIKPGDVDFPDVEVYYDTLKYLGSLYKELDETGFSPVLDLRLMTFYTFVPTEFVELSRKKRPRALVIIAHHLAFFKLVKNVWWTEGICDPQIRDICDFVGPEWQALLDVPRAATNLTEIEDIARLLLGNHTWESPPRDEIYKTNPDPRELWAAVWVNNAGQVEDSFPDQIT